MRLAWPVVHFLARIWAQPGSFQLSATLPPIAVNSRATQITKELFLADTIVAIPVDGLDGKLTNKKIHQASVAHDWVLGARRPHR